MIGFGVQSSKGEKRKEKILHATVGTPRAASQVSSFSGIGDDEVVAIRVTQNYFFEEKSVMSRTIQNDGIQPKRTKEPKQKNLLHLEGEGTWFLISRSQRMAVISYVSSKKAKNKK